MCSLYIVHGIFRHKRKKTKVVFCFVFCYYSLCHQLIFQKLMGQQKLILCEAAVMGTLQSRALYVGPMPVWGAALALDLWWSGVRCLRDMAKTLLKVMVRIGVSQVTFLSLHLSVF